MLAHQEVWKYFEFVFKILSGYCGHGFSFLPLVPTNMTYCKAVLNFPRQKVELVEMLNLVHTSPPDVGWLWI